MREAVHASVDFDHDMVVADEWAEVKFIENFFGDHAYVDAHVFGIFEWGAEVEVFEVEGKKFGVGC